jgi:hypothetical protein
LDLKRRSCLDDAERTRVEIVGNLSAGELLGDPRSNTAVGYLPFTRSLEDDWPAHHISQARIPLATLANLASDVRGFLKGSERNTDADSAKAAVLDSSIAVRAGDFSSPSLGHRLRLLGTFNGSQIDLKRLTIPGLTNQGHLF